jgi:hypothetical protein
MVEHSPVILLTLSRLLGFAFVQAFIELLIWTGLLPISERSVPTLVAFFGHFEHSLKSAKASGLSSTGGHMVIENFCLPWVGPDRRLAITPSTKLMTLFN